MQWSDEVKPLVKDLDLGMCCFEKSWGRLAKIMLTLLVKAKILNLCPWDTNVPNVKCSVFIDISFQLLGDFHHKWNKGTSAQLYEQSCLKAQIGDVSVYLSASVNWGPEQGKWGISKDIKWEHFIPFGGFRLNSQGKVWCKPSLLSLLRWLFLSGGSVPTLRRLRLHSLPLFWLPWRKAWHLMWPLSRYVVSKEKIIYCVFSTIFLCCSDLCCHSQKIITRIYIVILSLSATLCSFWVWKNSGDFCF